MLRDRMQANASPFDCAVPFSCTRLAVPRPPGHGPALVQSAPNALPPHAPSCTPLLHSTLHPMAGHALHLTPHAPAV